MEKHHLYPYQNLSLEDMEGEVWKAVKGFEEYYMASNLGRIKWLPRWIYWTDGRKRFDEEKIVTQHIGNSRGKSKTLFVLLSVEKVRHRMIVARIIYSNFVKPIPSIKIKSLYVLHKDLDPFNNKPENLDLATGKELTKLNIERGCNKVLISTPQIHNDLTKRKSRPVSQYSLSDEFICSYPSIREATRRTGINNKSIIHSAKGKQKHAGGFIWRYKSGI